jgi:imidazoleglycerol-phosphate dehydratase
MSDQPARRASRAPGYQRVQRRAERSTSTAPGQCGVDRRAGSTTTCSPRWPSTPCIDLDITATGDVEVDAHHTVEDVAICLGDALREALGDKRGISRFGDATVPLDEALVQAVVDVAGRPYCVHTGEPAGQEFVIIGGSYVGSLTRHVFETLAHHAGIALHVRVLAGRDPHHIVEAQFKAVARALRAAVARDPRVDGIPSAKGTLSQ